MNLTAKIGLNVNDFVSGLTKIEGQSDRSFNAVQREIAKLQASSQRLANSLQTPFEKLQTKISSLKIPDLQAGQLTAAFDENQMIKGAVAAEKMLVSIREQAQEYGKTAAEVQRLRLVKVGATAEQLKEFDLIQRNISAMREQRTATEQLAAAEMRRKQTLATLVQAAKGFVVGAIAVSGVRGIVELADGYSQLTAQLRNVSKSESELLYVQQRLSENSKTTYRSLQEATQSYIKISGSLKAIGYNTTEVLDFNDSLTYAFTASGTAADTAQTAIDALSRSFVKGSIDGRSWSLILQGVPSIAKQIAEYTGQSEAEVRKLGVSGQMSVDTLVGALTKAKDANKALADSMSISLRDRFQYLKNSLSEYLGQTNNAYSVTNTLAQGLKLLGDNIGVLVKISTIWAGLKLAGYAKAITLAFIAKAAAIYKNATAIAAETVAVSANTKAWAANAVARNIGGVKGLNNRAIGGIATAAGAAVGGGAITGTVGILAAGLVSFFDSILFLLGKKSNTIAGGFADGLTKFFSDGKYLSLGDLAYSKLSKQGRAEERAYQESLKQAQYKEQALSGDYKNLRAGLQDLGAEIQKQAEQFNNATISMQLAEKRIKLEEMKASGKDTAADILKLENELKELELKNQQNINQAGVDYIKSLQEQKDAIGKTNDELDLFKLATQGVNSELIEQARLQQAQNKQMLNNLAVQEKINQLNEQTARLGKSDRDLFSFDILKQLGLDKPYDLSQSDIQKQLGENYKLYQDALKAFDDKALKEKTISEQQAASVEKFSTAVDKFSGSDKTDKIDIKNKPFTNSIEDWWFMDWDDLMRLTGQSTEFVPYNSISTKELDKQLEQSATALHEWEQNLRTSQIYKMAGIDESQFITPAADTTALTDPLALAVGSETTALQDNTAAIREQTAILQTQATAGVQNGGITPQAGRDMGSMTLYISTDTETQAVKIFGTQAAIEFAQRAFAKGSERFALQNA